MTLGPLFNTMMQAERLATALLISRNIGGGTAEGTVVQPGGSPNVSPGKAAATADADPLASPNTSDLSAEWGATGPLQRSQNLPASHTLIGLRAALLAGGASDKPGGQNAMVSQAGSALAAPGTSGMPTPSAMPAMLLTATQGAGAAAAPSPTSDGDVAADATQTGETAGRDAAASRSNAAGRGGDPLDVAGPAKNAEMDDLRDQGAAARDMRAAGKDGLPSLQNRAMQADADQRLAAARQGAAAAQAPFDSATAASARTDRLAPGIENWMLAASSTTERAGIIASCILNAAMIPGWPQPRPFELTFGRALVPERQPPGAPVDENEAMSYLARMGASLSLLERIRKLLEPMARRLRMLLGLAVLATLMTSALRTLSDELAALEEELLELEENSERSRRGLAG